MKHKDGFSLICPCLNEEGNLRELTERTIRESQRLGIPCQVVLVDDGSTDQSWSEITSLTLEFGDAVLGKRHLQNEGIAAAWRTGLDATKFEVVVLIDADLQNTPETAFLMFNLLISGGYDVVRGVRRPVETAGVSRVVMSKILNQTLNLIFGMQSLDNKSGFIATRKNLLTVLLEHSLKFSHYQTFLGVATRNLGLTELEIRTNFYRRKKGVSFLNGKTSSVLAQTVRDIRVGTKVFGSGKQSNPSRIHRHESLNKPPLMSAIWLWLYIHSLPLHGWLIRPRGTWRSFRELKKSEFASAAELRRIQEVRLQRIVQFAAENSKFYRESFARSGIDPSAIRTVEDLASVPLLSKKDVRENLLDGLLTVDPENSSILKISTSGSTGEPFSIYASRNQLEYRFASTIRAAQWTGWMMGTRQCRLWHQTLGMSLSQVVRERIDALMMRRMFIPAFQVDPISLERTIRKINHFRPRLIDGYAESLNLIASYLIATNQKLSFRPQAVMSSAQALTQQTRDQIETAFGCKVYDKYGSREFSGIAYECGHTNLHHVVDECYIVELLVDNRPANPGEIGEVVITDLLNFATPLIRYRIGDLAMAIDDRVPQPCVCGRSHSLIGRIEGRTQAIIHCKNGTWMPGAFFLHFFKNYESEIRFFQIHQAEKGSFELRIVPTPDLTDQSLAVIIERLREYVGDTEIRITKVSEIPLVRTGKRSPIVSSVVEDFQQLGQRKTSDRI